MKKFSINKFREHLRLGSDWQYVPRCFCTACCFYRAAKRRAK